MIRSRSMTPPRAVAAAIALALAAGMTLGALPAQAARVLFSGTAMNINSAPAASAACAPLRQLSFGPAATAGASNLGDFTYSQTHCTTGGPGPYSGGIFHYFFSAGDVLDGTYSGLASLSGTRGLLNNTLNLFVTGGTGRFLGGRGSITGIGTVDFRSGPPRQQLTLTGALDLPAVPEPGTWALMISGFGLVGATLRRRLRMA